MNHWLDRLLAVAHEVGCVRGWPGRIQKLLTSGIECCRSKPTEPMGATTLALASEREHRHTTTSGTVLALRSFTLRNELPGTVREVALTPGQIVDAGTALVALDVSVEEAEEVQKIGIRFVD